MNKTRTLTMLALATSAAVVPAMTVAGAPSALERCVSAFVADLSNQSTTTLKLRDAHYESDQAFMPFLDASGSMTLTARDAHDHHALARAVCSIDPSGAVDLRAEPLVADNLH